MQPQRFFKVTSNIGASIFISEDSLMPQSHFTPEDKVAIAAIHAQHIEKYLKVALNPPIQIISTETSDYKELPGIAISKKIPFVTASEKTIIIQTIFLSFKDQIDESILENCRHLTLKSNTYI